MKRLSLLLISVLIFTASYSGEVTKTYSFGNYKIENAGEYQLVHFDNSLNTGFTGEPSLPWFAVKLLLPPGEKAVSFSVSGQKEISIPGKYILYPQQASRPISHGGSGIFQFNEDVYQSGKAYPAEAYGSISTEYLNGYSIALLNICPLIYLPADGQLSYYTEMTVTLKTEKIREAENALTMLSSTGRVLDKLNSFVQNASMISTYPLKENRSDDYQLLIITPQAFETDFDNLSGMYLFRGIKTEVMSVEEIGSTMSGQDLPEQIRNYIIQEYQAYNVEFVLLGGDVEHVPYRGFHCYVESGSGYTDDNIPADLYYSGLDGTWNDNGNNLWGEIGEDDLLPDIAVGRFSFSNLNELNAMIHKTTAYQDAPILGEMTNPLLAGEHLWSSPVTWGSDYMRLLIGFHDDNGYTTIGIPPEQNIDSLYERWQSWGGSTIMAEINEGKSFVHHCGHANSSSVMHLGISDITNANFSQVNGTIHNYTFVQSHGCICGAFDYSDCIMEHMAFIDNFAAAVIGNSRYGWFNEGQTEGPAAHLHREMVDALYEEEIGRIGAAFVECKIQTAPWVNAPGQHEEGALRWNFYDINILGDPTLQLWTEEPFTVDALFAAPIQLGATSLDVTVLSGGSPVEGMMCALTKEGVLHGTAITDVNGEATIIIDPLITTLGTAELTISGYNCLTKSYNVIVSPAAGPFIIYYEHILDDTLGGNSNGLPDYGESILMTIILANAGTADAINVAATLSSNDEYITITDDHGDYGTIAAGTTGGSINDYAFDVEEYVPDQHVAEFIMDISGDGKENWTSEFNITLNAPVLEAGQMTIDDIAGGNGNGFLDPGETAILTIGVLNTGHCNAPDAEASLSTISSWVSFTNSSFALGDLLPGVNAFAEFEITIDEDTPIGTVVNFSFDATSGVYTVLEDYAATIGILVEDWESGGFTSFNWQFAADAPWEMCSIEPWEGTYCAKSGNIGDYQESELFLTLEVLADGDLSFYRKLSSEAEWDFLRFYIDYNMVGEWSGELDWELQSFPVTQGLHTFRWVYEKDSYFSSGEDCAWLDFIVFPPIDISTGENEPVINAGPFMTLRPNPARSVVHIDYRLQSPGNVEIVFYDLRGQQLRTVQNNMHQASGFYTFSEDVSGLEAGVYLCRILTSEGIRTEKLVISR